MWIAFVFRAAVTTMFNGDERPKGGPEQELDQAATCFACYVAIDFCCRRSAPIQRILSDSVLMQANPFLSYFGEPQ
jgi:hypothetical protein